MNRSNYRKGEWSVEYGDRMALLREERDLTQEELAEIIGITRAALSHYEKNRRQPEYKILAKIASYFDVSIDWIINGNKIPIPDDPKYKGYSGTLEEEYARKGLSQQTQREILDAAVSAVEEARKRYNKPRK